MPAYGRDVRQLVFALVALGCVVTGAVAQGTPASTRFAPYAVGNVTTWSSTDFASVIRERHRNGSSATDAAPRSDYQRDSALHRAALRADLERVRASDPRWSAEWYPTFGMLPQTTQPTMAPGTEGMPASAAETADVSKLAQELSNPVGNVWVIQNQFNITQLKGGPFKTSEWQTNWNIQPVLPLHLTDEWNLILRPVIPLFFGSPYPRAHGLRRALAADLASVAAGKPWQALRRLADRRAGGPGRFIETDYLNGIGDIQLPMLLSPRKPPKLGQGELIWGVGPTFVFPTAGPSGLGAGQFQAGPAAVLLYLDKKWAIGAFAQQWWGFGGNENRPDQNHLAVQYFVNYQFAPGWQIGTGGPIVTADWTEPCSRGFTFPLGISLSKVLKIGKLPVKVAFEYDYAVVHPTEDVIGQRSIFKVTLSPVIPVLIPGNVLPF